MPHLDAFGYITPGTFEIGPMPGTAPSTFSDFTALKQRNSALVAGISLGGWTFNDNGTDTQPVFGDIVSSPANRQTFINNLLSFMRHYGFDAVDRSYFRSFSPFSKLSWERWTCLSSRNIARIT